MAGGLAVRGNLLCVGFCGARGHVLLFDLEAGQRVSTWTLPARAGSYSDACGVAMDEHYHVYVADAHNDRVCHFNAFGRHLGDIGLPPPASGDAGRDRPGVLDRPHAVAVRGEQLFVAMGDQPRRRGVQRFTLGGRPLRALPCSGDPERKFGAPRGLWADAQGLWVADTLRGVLQQFGPDARFVREWVCAGVGAARPVAVVRLPDGGLLYADRGDRPGLRAIDRGGRARDLEALQPVLHDPIALSCDRAGRVYVLDRGGERVVRLAPDLQVEQILFDLAELDLDPPRSS